MLQCAVMTLEAMVAFSLFSSRLESDSSVIEK